LSEGISFRDMLEELSGMEHAVTSHEASLLQSMREMAEAEIEPRPIHIGKLKQIYQKYIGAERFDPDAQVDF
jgi:hypothetical protein